jgi:hypothetical protein
MSNHVFPHPNNPVMDDGGANHIMNPATFFDEQSTGAAELE